jgi:hypothetical protein
MMARRWAEKDSVLRQHIESSLPTCGHPQLGLA